MTVNVGVMQLPVTEDPDPVRTYLNGTHPSGGLWTALTRASNHDHSGGLNGIQLTATSIPDGSITAAKLDPAVLLPYALVDGSKPFTGAVTMDADALVRDTLRFGAKPAGVADATLARTGAGALTVGANLTVNGTTGGEPLRLNRPEAAAGYLAQQAFARAGADKWHLGLNDQDGFALYTGDLSKQRLIVNTAGTLTLTPDAGQAALIIPNAGGPNAFVIQPATGNDIRLGAANAGEWLELYGAAGGVLPYSDGTQSFGQPTRRWATLYSTVGAINTSSAAVKEGITPLDPAAAYQAAKDVRWYDFRYALPTYTAPEPPPDLAYDEHDDNATKAEKKAARDEAEANAKAAYARMLVETAPARHQRGYVYPAGAEAKDEAGGTLPPVPDLFGLSDRESTTPQADIATLGCAFQHMIGVMETLQAEVASLKASQA